VRRHARGTDLLPALVRGNGQTHLIAGVLQVVGAAWTARYFDITARVWSIGCVPSPFLFLFLAFHPSLFSQSLPLNSIASANPNKVGRVRTLREWPSDVDQVLLQENVDKFYAMGASAGCIHVAAVAAAFPSRLRGVAFASPTAPKDVEDKAGISIVTRTLKGLLQMDYVGDLLADFITNVIEPEDMVRYGTTDASPALDRLEREGEGFVVENFLNDTWRAVKNTHRGWVDNIHVLMDKPPFEMTAIGEVSANGGRSFIFVSRSSQLGNDKPARHQDCDHDSCG